MNKRVLISIATVCLAGYGAGAQFYDIGTEPGSTRWSFRSGTDFKVYYPEQTDSLAVKYLEALERWRTPVGASIGRKPNQSYRHPMDVVLHPLNPIANGSVAWSPRRMALYTVQDPYSPEPYPWIDQLAVHESRHVAQMQFGREGKFNALYFLTGQLTTGALSGVYGGPALLEGDAVTAETALTASGRGRTADFLEYMMVALDSGDWRDWYRWRYGSQRYYTPDYYRIGYVTVAGMRTLYDDPLFTRRFYDNIIHSRWLLPANVLRKTMKQASGKRFKDTFREIEEHFQREWEQDAQARAPYMPSVRLTAVPDRFESLTSTVLTPEGMFALRSGITRSRHLVRIGADGSVTDIRPFASYTSALRWSDSLGRLYWSETAYDLRWELKGGSRIGWWDPVSGESGYVTGGDQRYFNPSPAPSDARIAVTCYPVQGGSSVVVLDGRDGTVIETMVAPDGLQVVETAWDGERIVASVISQDGEGLYEAGSWTPLVDPRNAKIKQLQGCTEGGVWFVSDLDGVNELYRLSGKSVLQYTCTHYGAADFAMDTQAGRLYYSSLDRDSRGICYTDTDSLPVHEMGYTDVYKYAIADKLSEQEAVLAAADTTVQGEVTISAEKHYSKLLHPLSIHSWAPLYVDYDEVSSLSGDDIEESAELGLTAWFQNRTGTLYGSIGAAMHGDGHDMRPAGHLNLTYSGLWPVLDLDLAAGERDAMYYGGLKLRTEDNEGYYVVGSKGDKPYINAKLRAYVPLNLSRGGWIRGVIPGVKTEITNDLFDTSVLTVEYPACLGEGGTYYKNLRRLAFDKGSSALYNSTTVSVRAYSVLSTPSSCVYPRWGGGAELGYMWRSGLGDVYTRDLYAYLYAYVPGIMRQHGVRLTGTIQVQTNHDKALSPVNTVTTAPRGMRDYDGVESIMARLSPVQGLLTAEYAIPMLPVEWHIGQLTYIRNFELKPHFDFSFGSGDGRHDTLYSAGASFCAHLGNLAWLPFDGTAGITCSYNGGSLFSEMSRVLDKVKHLYIGTVFRMDL